MSKITVTTIAGQTSGSDANKVKIESGDTLEVTSNATVGGTAAITGNTTVGGTLGVTGATTTTGGVTIPASTTVGLNFGSGTNLAQLAMQSAVLNRVALRTTHTSTGDNNPFIIYQPSSSGVQNDALVIHSNGVVTKAKHPAVLAQGQTTAISTGVTDYWYIAIPERFDTTSAYDPSTGIFTAPVAGKYKVDYHLDLSSSESGSHSAVSVNNSTSGGGGGYVANHAWQIRTGDYMHWSGLVNLAANDTARILIYPTSAKNKLDVNTERNHLTIHLVG